MFSDSSNQVWRSGRGQASNLGVKGRKHVDMASIQNGSDWEGLNLLNYVNQETLRDCEFTLENEGKQGASVSNDSYNTENWDTMNSAF